MTGHAAGPHTAAEHADSRWRRAVDAVDERMGLTALAYEVPEHANNLAWSLGALTAISFLLLLVTGIYIAQWYDPMPEVANQSVRTIMTQAPLGALARGLHYWAAQAMYVLALLHMLRVFLHGSFKRPREGNWLVGAVMLLLTFLAVFTGTVLKWDQEGFEALSHNLDVAELVGGAGIWFTAELAPQVPIVVRLYAGHAVIIPGLILSLFVVHALLVKRHKISEHPDIPGSSAEEPAPFTEHLKRAGAYGLVLLGILAALSVLVPPVVGSTPVAGVETTRPLWLFWWFFPFEEWFGISSVGVVMAVVFGVLFLVPFLDRGRRRSWRERKVAVGVLGVIVLFMLVISIYVWINNARGH
ncbi:ubiquinol-cytochrome c reductase cytochrome b subunit [Georgenia soli]|uniref:Cytochrome bc1 complex cytochrome b subunit n=1 Tax=Georgenia soli TaxID=638953 RepID=A0A2A9F3L5_9MICO|nr:cytochrome b N-terminal domain-containing protein [Georgenia soli]PFG44999.1 ubiquinol-cytochrome c reductase cytochrome b subunit [Georgenia soli]